MEKFLRSLLAVIFVVLFALLPGCETAPSVPPAPGAVPAQGTRITQKEAIDRFFDGKELDPIEGIWVWSDNNYEVAIVKNELGIENSYEYAAILLRSETPGWKAGQIKLLLNSSAADGIFTGVYFMGNQSRENTSFILEQNLLRTFIPITPPEVLIIRNFPKNSSKESGTNDKHSRPSSSQGTGFFISEAGHIITNYHVVDGADEIFITLSDGSKVKCDLVKSSPSTDLAVLKSNYNPKSFLRFSEGTSLDIGDKVYTIGFPSVDLLGIEPKLTDGVVSSLTGLKSDSTFLQVTVPIQPGNSGGPLIDEGSGRVVGIVTSTAAVEAFYNITGSFPQNINWAVKSDYAKLLSAEFLVPSSIDQSISNPSELAQAIVIIEAETK